MSCIFCRKNNLLPPPIESFAHVFFDCPIVYSNICKFLEKYVVVDVSREEYFTGKFNHGNTDEHTLRTIFDVLRYCIWQTRLLKNNLSFPTYEQEVIYCLKGLSDANSKVKDEINNCTLLCIAGRAAERRRPP